MFYEKFSQGKKNFPENRKETFFHLVYKKLFFLPFSLDIFAFL
jgi:hypothetical protein